MMLECERVGKQNSIQIYQKMKERITLENINVSFHGIVMVKQIELEIRNHMQRFTH